MSLDRLPWKRVTEKARATFWAADEEAARLGQHEVEVEHLLVALMRDEESIACRLLKQASVQPQTVAAAIAAHCPQCAPPASQERNLSMEAHRSIDNAFEEAQALNCHYIGTEHLLLGLLRDQDSIAGRTLLQCGVTYQQIRDLWEAYRQEVD